MSAPTEVTTYMSAVADALTERGIDVRGQEADDTELQIGIDLTPIAEATPVLVWTPGAGWRIAVAVDGEIRLSSLRYLCAGFAPWPNTVGDAVARWYLNPDSLSRLAPAYPRHSRATVLEELVRTVRDDLPAEQDGGDR